MCRHYLSWVWKFFVVIIFMGMERNFFSLGWTGSSFNEFMEMKDFLVDWDIVRMS